MSLRSTDYRIEIANQQRRRVDEQQLVSAVELILTEYQVVKAEISIAVVDDPTMRDLNNRYLEHDYETDVLSFVLAEDKQEGSLEGQLIVSFDTAARVARELNVKADDELLLYVVHGTLHLVGLNDKNQADQIKMRAEEQRILLRLGVPHHWPENQQDTTRNDIQGAGN